MHHISIILINFNSPQETLECLQSLKKVENNKNFKFNIIILDNGSKEKLVLPKKFATQNFELLRSESNLGFAGGNNLCIKHAIEQYNSDFILLLNNDTVVHPDFLKNLYNCAQSRPKAGLINSKIYFYPGTEFHNKSYKKEDRGKIIWFAGGSIDWRNLVAFHRGVDEIDRGQFDQITKSDFATGCCVLIRRELIETIRMLNEKLFLYLEDVDYSLRAKRAGFEILFCPQSLIWHKNAGSAGGSGSDLQLYYQTRNRLYLFLKYGDPKIKLNVIRLILQILIKNNKIEKQALSDFLVNKMGKKAII